MTRRDILLMSPLRPGPMAQLDATYALHRYDRAKDKAAFLAEVGPRCEAAVIEGHEPLTAGMLDQLPNLRGVACATAGFDRIDVAALKHRGIWFTNASAALRDDVADTAVMLTLAARRQLLAGDAWVRSGDWGLKGMYPLLTSLRGQHVGIVGLGTIGAEIARRFSGFSVEIGYTARREKEVPYARFESPRALARWSDVLVVVVPGGPATRNLIDADVLAALGPGGTLVNVARGEVVDEAALIAALTCGALGSAGLDVFRNEPDPDPALTRLPNVTLYPHHASGTVETRDAMSQLVVDNLAAYFSGRPLLTPVDLSP